ncbi:hypothetical protein [Novilysobacter selenitireducens]|uniref:Uncharacterized protein n=1 Tax=Novilysobacter selenitireducens TaxID=2872639 RepID=A0ABS7T782_9GAMM|nr:hypothetical protein [Lysobacter selenitireducens]MBZ4039742.1 hypothetical protein [Lysobacter selenitireducens]
MEHASGPGMTERERRKTNGSAPDTAALRAGLTPAQLKTLATMEQFRWSLRFVRRPLFQDPVPVLFAPDGRYVVLNGDGTIDETPTLKLRD